MSAILWSLVEKKAAGELLGLLVSKTQWGASTATVTALWTVLPQALQGDAEAIGQTVLIIGGWLMALYGRVKAGK